MKKITVAMIGAWGHGTGVLAALDKIPDLAEVVGLAKVLPEDDFTEIKKRFGICRDAPCYGDYCALLAERRPRVAVVSARLDRIAPVALEAARTGCHLLCEKPLALDYRALDSLSEAVAAAKVQCLAILDNRAHPVLRAARRTVLDGAVGNVILCNARKSYKFGKNRPDWFGRRDLYGGTIPWLGIHGLDFIETVTGLGFTSVAAMHGNMSHKTYPDCEDHCALIFGLSNGGHATLSLDFLRPDAAPSHGDDWLRVVGSRGVIEAYMARNTCTLTTVDQPPAELPLPEKVNFYADLFEALRDDPDSLAPSTARAFYLTRACLCARDAADNVKVVSIPPDTSGKNGLHRPLR